MKHHEKKEKHEKKEHHGKHEHHHVTAHDKAMDKKNLAKARKAK